MSPSLSWIEESAISERLSELARPARLPIPSPASERPAPATEDGGVRARERRPAAPPSTNGHAAPQVSRSAPPSASLSAAPRSGTGLARSPAPPSVTTPSGGSARTVATAPPVAANQDPWTLTPHQPWNAVASPSEDLQIAEIPELLYPPTMALAARLEVFRDWIRMHSGDGAFFVSDAEGLPLLLERVRTSQAVTAVALERAMHPLRGLLGTSRANALCIELEDGRLVQTVWAKTTFGRIAVGMAPPQPLGPAATAQIRRALLGLFDEENAE